MATMTKRLYTLANGLGLVEDGSKEDPFHQLVYGITGKEHVSELTAAEARAVQAELQERMRLKNHDKPLKKKKEKESKPDMMTVPMKNYAKFLAHRLEELDEKTPSVPAGFRLAGAVRKVLGITASDEDPLKWVHFQDGMKLIEQLKRYVRSAERKAAKKASDDSG